jgi:hypothetical protein
MSVANRERLGSREVWKIMVDLPDVSSQYMEIFSGFWPGSPDRELLSPVVLPQLYGKIP